MPQVSVIIPTFNEADNVRVMWEKLKNVLGDWDWELIFVDDDSPDGTSNRVADIANEDSRVRLIRRIGRRGLSSASIEGFMASVAPYIVLMDADGQHDEGGGDRNAEAGQDQQHQRRQHMPPLNPGFRIRDAVQTAEGDIAVLAEISVEHDGDDDARREGPQDQPGALGVGRQECPEGLDDIVRHNSVGGEHEAYECK